MIHSIYELGIVPESFAKEVAAADTQSEATTAFVKGQFTNANTDSKIPS